MKNLPQTLYSAAQARELDRIAIEVFGIPGYQLMCRAGGAMFDCMVEKWPEARSLVVFCGSGNNAGDGYVIARLAQAAGIRTQVISVGEPEKLKGDALTAFQDYRQAGGTITHFQEGKAIDADLLVDALLGTGLDRPVAGIYADSIRVINQAQIPVISADIPSGLNADTGHVMGSAVKADCTVTFIGLKQGLFTGQAADYVGEIVYDALAVPDEVFGSVKSSVFRVLQKPMMPRRRCAHKGNMGHVLIIGGDLGYSGAARMAGEAALRVGTGLVSIATRSEHAGLMNLNRPELMCRGVESDADLAPLLDKTDVLVLGPGLGQGAWGKEMFNAVLKSDKPIVLDADGLNLLAESPMNKTHCILTPHPGEAARLLRTSSQALQQDRFAAVEAIRATYGSVVVLKGAGSLIASDSRIAVSITGNPGMASGGMGDVLSGVIAGLLAQGLDLHDAAEQGVFLHGRAADLAAAKDGERGLLATDLLPFLRQLVN
ncbi:NAD(P)H-hydrate dehydratase [Methylomicrobium sp. Wu6]|uniref:NAD(P)H-hydrate dehydratase n=1 Tax=Methylomicrobium sp. Wu6 TaxID=3107928 RepID=UPI002DD68BEF|nr:NAD(P)H-hydrate dehydratase [Methylomicrobium sp. Wu6]MEC4749321.1 NAD(P)H-hydrate dehydratase [Methylomicrobium sp. Wu6]